jgi:lipopolysaccharide export system protein LptA
MRKVLLLLGLTLAAAQSAVAQQPTAMTITAKEIVQRENGSTTVSGEAVIRIGDVEIRTDRADIRRLK